jgi:hypothetical protein
MAGPFRASAPSTAADGIVTPDAVITASTSFDATTVRTRTMRTAIRFPARSQFIRLSSRGVSLLGASLGSARGLALTLTLAASGAFVAQAAVASAPSAASDVPAAVPAKKFAPRTPFRKLDPVENLLPKKFRGVGLYPSHDVLTGEVIVKFNDNVKARVATTGAPITSKAGVDLSAADAILAKYGGVARQWIRKSESELASIETRARDHSGREQPDLAGMIVVTGVPFENLYDAAWALNDLGTVEFVSLQRNIRNLQEGCDPQNPADCNVPSPTCTLEFPGNGDGIFRTECNPDPNADPIPYGCNDVTCCNLVGGIDPACIDEEDTGGWDVYCAAWANLLCTGTIYEAPPDDGPYDPCFNFDADQVLIDTFAPVVDQFQNASCVTQHAGRGCNQPECCAAVCLIDPTCCGDAWDATCANLVLSGQFATCVIPTPTTDASPDLSAQQTAQGLQGFQFYTQSGPRAAELVDVSGLGTTWIGAIGGGALGFSGHGFALQEFEDFQQLIWQFYQAGDPDANPFLGGNGIRIGVLETSGYTQHEEFILAGPAKNPQRPWEGPLLPVPRVISEPGFTPVYAESGPISANHGTNVMGVILAGDNGFGVTGMAPNAQGYFFPIVAAETGFRAQDALASALAEFTAGDVMNFSWGFMGAIPYMPTANVPTVGGTDPSVQPVTSDVAFSLLLATAADLGITSVVAAGSGPAEIQGSGQAVDVGAIIVTAVWPGNMLEGTSPLPGYACCSVGITEDQLSILRYPGSNYEAEDIENPDESADASAWGFGVVTTGGSTVFNNNTVPNPEIFLFQGTNDQPPGAAAGLQVDRLRMYTQEFGGTSAAAAMVSGLVARIQASARQFYGTSIAPAQVRAIMQSAPSSYLQCPWALGGDIFTADIPFREDFPADGCTPPGPCSIECVPPGCPCEFKAVAVPPNFQQIGGTILSADLFDGNTSTVDVLTGGQLIGYAWNPFQIKAVDGNYLRIVAQPRNAGTTVEGLTYMSTGRTTDVRVEKTVTLPDPQKSVNSLGLNLVSRATRNFVFCGVFIYNFERGRYEFFGAQFLNTVADGLVFPLPPVGAFGAYINPATNKVDMRVWTCGIGATGRHNVEHDFIDIVINDPQAPL